MKRILLSLALLPAVFACREVRFTESGAFPPIVPDYIGTTIPEGMAALSFEMEDGRPFRAECERVGDTLFYTVRAWDRKTREGVRYAPFPVYLSHDAIDPYIAYRLIEPGYESWGEIGLYGRELASYREKPIVTSRAAGGNCVNCHNFPGGDPSQMLFHVRGAGGGTMFLKDGQLHLLNLTTVGPHRQGVYPAWHPSGRYVAFSSNSTQQSFPITGTQQVEVYDHFSDLILMDLQTDSVMVYDPLCETSRMETFPSWAPDGNSLYFCMADSVSDVAAERAKIHYSLQQVDFRDGAFTGEPRTVWESDTISVSFPRVNGKWLLFTASAYGTFPIWHREADLWLLDLETGEARPAEELNSDDTESYHSWSSNGRWVVFSSRRLDGRYTRLYFAHFDGEGHFSKPFLLPQKKASYNDLRLQSYNVPEFVLSDPGQYDSAVRKMYRR
jgi:hypothetical protein